uniref:Small ribosomal subunit protein uS5 n=1 Tax=Chinchilla lanigera TaxID=34839 RepID=A0A8C2UHK1_CHILA
MADDAGAAGGPGGPGMGGRSGLRGGFGSGLRGRGRSRGLGRGRGRGRGARSGKPEDKKWIPVTKLGRLVKDMKIKSLEEIYLFSSPIKESECLGYFSLIIDFFLGTSLKDEVLKIMPVQKQARAGQQTRFKAFVATGDYNGHAGLVRLIPAPRGTGIVSLLLMAGTDDCYTSARGCTATLGNFAKATFDAISKTYSYLTPDLWKEVSVQRTQAPAVATT